MRSVTNLGILVCVAFSVGAQTAPPRLTATYCVGCHNQKLRTAGVSLEGLDPDQPEKDAAVWERVAHVVRHGMMPPPGLPRPDAAVAARALALASRPGLASDRFSSSTFDLLVNRGPMITGMFFAAIRSATR